MSTDKKASTRKTVPPKTVAPKTASAKTVAPKAVSAKAVTPKTVSAKTTAAKTKTKKTVDKKNVEVKEPVQKVVETAPVEATAETPVVAGAPVNDKFENFDLCLGNTNKQIEVLVTSVQEGLDRYKTLLVQLREMNKTLARERKEVQKLFKMSKLRNKKKGNRAPGGFTKPVPLSEQMCTFLDVAQGTEMPRTEVTRRVTRYVKEQNLQNEANRKQILPDSKIKTLLYVKDDDELTYFNLQRFMKIHFLKKDKETGVIATFAAPW